MEQLRGIVLVLIGIFLLSWYASAIIQSPIEYDKLIEVDASYEEVQAASVKYDPGKDYTYKHWVTIRKQKTYIPLVYKRDTLKVTGKTLYSVEKTGCN